MPQLDPSTSARSFLAAGVFRCALSGLSFIVIPRISNTLRRVRRR